LKSCTRRLLGLAISTVAVVAVGSAVAGGPCDIYQAAGTPCVAAHSTVRALYAAYSGNLYQVRRASDKTTKDIGLVSTGGVANSAVQDSFCAKTTCTISKIYDQSSKANHLVVTPPGGWLGHGGTEATATAAKIKLNGYPVYGVYTTGSFDTAVGGVGYRNNKTSGVATGDQPEAIYMVMDGKHYNQYCCFDYGNAETDNTDDGSGTMEAVFFGNSTQWGKGSGNGPWVMADLENGLFAGQSFAAPATNISMTSAYVTGMVKGNSGNSWAIKGGDASSGSLATLYTGVRPTGYNPMKKEGAIILGTGGDNSHTGQGTFFEGCMVSGFPSDATDNAVQANIVAAGYGSTTTAIAGVSAPSDPSVSMRSDFRDATTTVAYSLKGSSRVLFRSVDLEGREVARIVDGVVPPGFHEAVWDTRQTHAGVYVLSMEIDGRQVWSGNVLVGR